MREYSSTILKVDHISKRFDLNAKQRKEKKTTEKTLLALDSFSFELKKGEIYGLLGPNGAGKTTALRIIASLIKPTEGNVYYNEKNINDIIEEYRSHIAFLTSELKLDDFFTPNYTFDYMASLYGLSKEASDKRKAELFKEFGIESFSESKIGDLSTGMKQKASLAISLCHDPDIIIFDEPTNGLDIIASKEVENFLIKQREAGKTILLSTHIFSLVEKLCDRVGILLNGKLVEEGNLNELTKDSSLEEVFFSQYEGKR